MSPVCDSIRARATMALVIALSMAPACREPSPEQVETTAVVPVAVAAAAVRPLRATITATGIVAAAPDAELLIVAPAAGRIAQLPHAEGDRVTPGEVLVRFDVPTLAADLAAARARVGQATARLAAARANAERLASLLEQGVAAPRDVEEAARQKAEAEGDLEQARSTVVAAAALDERAIVRAPFAGVVAQRFHNPGDLVEPSAGDPVIRFIDPSRLQVVAAVPAADLSRVVAGRPAAVQQPGGSDRADATVLVRAAHVDAAAGTGSVRLGFVTPTRLTAGTTVEVEIVAEERAQALTIPLAAIVSDGADRFVMVVGDDGKAHKRPVRLGLTTRTAAEVTSGVTAGERVIVRGQDGIPDGAAVAVDDK